MRSMRSVLALAAAILTLGGLVPSVAAVQPAKPVHLVKDCSTYNAVAPTYCTISESDLDALPVGTKVWYNGPVLTNSYFLSSNITLDPENGSTATGYCIFNARSSKGMCTFWAGTGALSGFHAIIDVTIAKGGLWHFDGSYYFSDATLDPSYEVEAAPRTVVTTVKFAPGSRPW